MNKLLLLNILLLSSAMSLFSQQVPLNNHYLVNPFVLNPAETGTSANTNIYLIRNQRFAGFGGATINNYLTADGNIMKGKAGIGFQLAQQQHGIQQQISSSLSYSYGIQVFTDHHLRFGISAGILDNRIDMDAINVLQTDDPYLMTMRNNVSSFDMSAGLLYTYKNLKVGFSVPQVLANKVTFDEAKSRGYYRLSRHFMTMAQYDFLLNKNITLTPNALLRIAPGAPIQYDLTAQVNYQKKYWASVTYKSDYAVQFNAGLQIFEQFKLGYSYELVTGSIKNYSSGVHHEVLIGFTFKNGNKGKENVITEIIHDTIIKNIVVQDENQIARIKELEEKLRKSIDDRDFLVQEIILKNKETQVFLPPVLKDSTAKAQSEIPDGTEDKAKDNDLIRDSEFYTFIELDASKSPDGYYVISGVYSSRQNADKEVVRIKSLEPSAYMVISTNNNFYYLVTMLTNDRTEALAKCRESRKLINKNTWIIDYRK